MSWEGNHGLAPFVAPAILRAINDLNARSDILPSTRLEWVWDDSHCTDTNATEAMMDMKLKYDVHGIIGPPCSLAAQFAAPVGAYWDLPFISWYAQSPALSDKHHYPNFARVKADLHSSLALFIEFGHHVGWEAFGVVYADNDVDRAAADDLIASVEGDPTLSVGFTHIFPDTTKSNANHSEEWLPLLRFSGTRVVVVIGYCVDERTVMIGASRQAMLEGYQYLFINISHDCHVVEGDGWPDGWGPEANAEAAEAFNNTLTAYVAEARSEERFAFEEHIRADFASGTFERFRLPPSGTISAAANVTRNPFGLPYSDHIAEGYDESTLTYAALLYDAIQLYAHAADAAIRTGLDPAEHPEEIVRLLRETSFTGVSGRVRLNGHLDRISDILLEQVQVDEALELRLQPVGLYQGETATFVANASTTILHPGGTATPPAAVVPHQCSPDEYEHIVDELCNDDLELHVAFVMKEGIICQGMPSDASVECVHVTATSETGLSVMVVAGASIVLALACAVWVIYYINEAIVRHAQPTFCLLYLTGCVILNASSLLRIGWDDQLICVVSPWLFHLAFTLCFTAVLAKVCRVWWIFLNDKLQRRKVAVRDTIIICAVLMSVDAAILTVMTTNGDIGPVSQVDLTAGSNVEVEQQACAPGGVGIYVLWIMKAGVMLVTCLLAWQVRDVDEKFAESRHIMLATYQATLMCAVAGMITAVSSSVPLKVLLQAFAAAVATAGSICAVFGPKVRAVYLGTDISSPVMHSSQDDYRMVTSVSRMKVHTIQSSSASRFTHGHGGSLASIGPRASEARKTRDCEKIHPHVQATQKPVAALLDGAEVAVEEDSTTQGTKGRWARPVLHSTK